MSMRILRVLHAGTYSTALAVAMIGLGGGCGDSPPPSGTVVKEAPGEAEARAKLISEKYKSGGGGTTKPSGPAADSNKKH
jgi:hypothetical protein